LQTRARSDSSQRTPVSHNTTTEQREKERGKERETKREKKENTALSFLSSAHPTSVHGPDECSCLVNYFRTLVVQIQCCSLVVYCKYNILFITMVTLQT